MHTFPVFDYNVYDLIIMYMIEVRGYDRGEGDKIKVREAIYTEFGSLLSQLMEERGMNAAALAAALTEHGYEVNEVTLVAYMRDEREVDPRLPKFLVRELALVFEEQMALALAFTFDQSS